MGNGFLKIHFDDDIHWKLNYSTVDYGIDVLYHSQDPGPNNKQSTFTLREERLRDMR